MKIVSFTRGDYEIPGKNADQALKLDTKEQNLVYITLNFVFAFMMRLFEKFKDNMILVISHYLLNFARFDIRSKSNNKPILSYLKQ